MVELAGKRIVILGLARQGRALARFAAESGAETIVSDLRSSDRLQSDIDMLSDLDITYVLGGHPPSLLDGTDMLALSGGVPTNIPIVDAARNRGIILSNDSQEFILRTRAKTIGITGSAGKTTTTSLTGAMARAAGRKTWVGGNIGRPLIAELPNTRAEDLVVQELSSFQLELWRTSPSIAAVLNITPNHLDRHKTMKAYVAAKANILRYQKLDDIALLPLDDPGAAALEPLVNGRLRQFSAESEVGDGSFIREGHIWLRDQHGNETLVCPAAAIQLLGQHNVLNVLAAAALADSAGTPVAAIADAIQSFKGVEHRLELVAKINGAQYVNDSIATAPERAIAAMSSFEEDLILLAGGKDKNMSWNAWAEFVTRRVKHVILFGELAGVLFDTLTRTKRKINSGIVISRVGTMADAVSLAMAAAVTDDVVLLSPGGTSFDAYDDFAKRGNHFKAIVMGYANI